ncbi:MAG: TolC family protein [Microcoleaceae cyanobacterium MO_207.B10]|nr:TolC family protein [Microcoleaceae cyanobacterium MO_207.B10]
MPDSKSSQEIISQTKALENNHKFDSSLLDLAQSNTSVEITDLTDKNSHNKSEITLNKQTPEIKITEQGLYSGKNYPELSQSNKSNNKSNSSLLALPRSKFSRQAPQPQTQNFKQSLTQNAEKNNTTSLVKNLANSTINSNNSQESLNSKSDTEIIGNSINEKLESQINSLLDRKNQITTSANYAPPMATVNDFAKVETQASALINSHTNINSKSTIPQRINLPGRTRRSTTQTIQFPSADKNSEMGHSAQIMTSTNSDLTTTTVPNLATTPLTIAQETTPIRSSINTFPPPVPNGTLQTNPPPQITPNSNPLYIPINPDEVQIQQTIPITLQEAIDLARRNNPSIEIAQLELERSRAAMREAQAALWPSLTFQSTLQRTESAIGDLQAQAQRRVAEVTNRPEFQDTDIQNFPTTTFTNSFEFDYDTGVGGTRGARIGVAREQIRLRELELERIAEELRLNVSNDYYDLQESDGRVRIGEAAVNNARKSLEDAEALERAGVGTRFDVLQSQVTLANEQQNLTNALRDQRAARRRLSERLSINESIDLTAADPIEPAGSWPLSLDETIVEAFQKRAELEQQLVQRDLSEQQRKLAMSAIRPSLNFFATYSVLGLTTDNNSWRAARGWADGTTVGARFRWNFFDGGAARAAARQSRVDQEIAVSRFEEVQNQVRREVEEAFFSLEASFENIATAELGVEQAKEALRLARLRFQAGVGTQLEVIQQETDLTRAENNLLTAIIDYNRALSELQRSVSNLPGGDLFDTP